MEVEDDQQYEGGESDEEQKSDNSSPQNKTPSRTNLMRSSIEDITSP